MKAYCSATPWQLSIVLRFNGQGFPRNWQAGNTEHCS